MRNDFPLISMLALLFAPALVPAAETEHITPCTGTWELNVAKSTFQPGTIPKSVTLRFTPDGKNIVSGIDGEGKAFEWAIPWSDGKEVRIEGIENATGTQIIRGHSNDVALKQGGKTFMTIQGVLSPDGKTQTATVTRIDEKGGRIQHKEFYEKQ